MSRIQFPKVKGGYTSNADTSKSRLEWTYIGDTNDIKK